MYCWLARAPYLKFIALILSRPWKQYYAGPLALSACRCHACAVNVGGTILSCNICNTLTVVGKQAHSKSTCMHDIMRVTHNKAYCIVSLLLLHKLCNLDLYYSRARVSIAPPLNLTVMLNWCSVITTQKSGLH